MLDVGLEVKCFDEEWNYCLFKEKFYLLKDMFIDKIFLYYVYNINTFMCFYSCVNCTIIKYL